MSKKTAPLKRTALNTSDNASISKTSSDGRARMPDAQSFARGAVVIRLGATRLQGAFHRDYDSQRPLFLRRSAIRSEWHARRHGLLPLRILSHLVGRPHERIQPVEPGKPAHYERCPEHRGFRQDRSERPQVVHEVRRSSVHGSSALETRGYLRGAVAAV